MANDDTDVLDTDTDAETGTDTETDDTAEEVSDDAAKDETGEQSGKAGSEAARYRRRLRETEAERDALRTQLAAQHESLLAGVIEPKLVRAAGFDPAEALDDNGVFDPDKAADLARRTNGELGLGPRRPLPVSVAGQSRDRDRGAPRRLAGAFSPENLHRG
ncbi:hypothetical protein D2E76_27850 [Mycobacteroides abscessus]|uniref:Scaffolding protein n=1 Tax=Mycobacteroides abscessus TaxID=36809 RepID=A0ABD7HG69_9MYCO|nr:hypothetical protein [Mycobacteroides abscessus]RIT26819.1 hypothetical protein D2E76_27850 [Mycobacteroides abscessus]